MATADADRVVKVVGSRPAGENAADRAAQGGLRVAVVLRLLEDHGRPNPAPITLAP